MNAKSKIEASVYKEIIESLNKIEQENDIVILQAIESGSRAWGFPSPDSDYDVRFIYAHSNDWYIQLNEQRDVIELPISDELDIAGWDLRKALNLANKGNAVVQEWMISPIVYQQSNVHSSLYDLVNKTFNPTATYHHYRSMAKKAYSDIEQSEQKKLKRFFYFARATLSTQWVLKKQTMPSIVFFDLVEELIVDASFREKITDLVDRKLSESEKSNLEVPAEIYRCFVELFESFEEKVALKCDSIKPVSNQDFRDFLIKTMIQR